MRHIFICALAVLLLFAGCKKTDTKAPPIVPPVNPPVPTQIVFSLNRTTATPGDVVEIKANSKLTADEVSISLNNVSIKGFKSGDSAYQFVVPVIAAGNISISIPAIKNSNTITLTISAYNVITNTQAVVTEFITKRNAMIDSLIRPRPGYNLQPSAESMLQFSQLKEEWDIQYAGLSAGEKDILAYVLQKNMPDPAAFVFTSLPGDNYANQSFKKGDAGDQLVAIAKTFVTAEVICIGSIPFVISNAVFLGVAPNPMSASLFLASWTTFLVSREVAIMRAKEVGNLKGIADVITGENVQKIATVKFSMYEEKDLSMSVLFRNLSAADAGIQADISAAFNQEDIYITSEAGLIVYYNKVKPFLTKLKAPFTPHKKIIGEATKGTMEIPLEGKEILVNGVSDNRIIYSTRLVGTTKKVKIMSAYNEKISFNLQVAYARLLDGKELTKDIPCELEPISPGFLSMVSGNNQSATAYSTLTNPLVVLVKDMDGNVMPNVSVTWTIDSGGGQLPKSTTSSETNGQASNDWKVGPTGTQTVSASVKKEDGSHVSGSPVIFSAKLNIDTLELLRSKTWTLKNGPIKQFSTINNPNCTNKLTVPSLELHAVTLSFNVVNGQTQGTETKTGICQSKCGNYNLSIGNPCTVTWTSVPTSNTNSMTIYSVTGGMINTGNHSPQTAGAFAWILYSGKILAISGTELIIVNPWYPETLIFK